MKTLFNKIKDSIKKEYEKQDQEQQQREEKLIGLENIQNQKNFKILHPVQASNNRKQIKRLKKEIQEHNKKKKAHKIVVGVAGIFVVLFAFIGIMSAIDGEDPTYADTDTYNYTEGSYEETVEKSSSNVVLETECETVTEEITNEDVVVRTEFEDITETNTHIHEYQSATCSSPKVCLVCGDEVGLPVNHDYVNGTCLFCGEEDQNYASEEMVWIPTNGGKRYHRRSSCSNMEDPSYVTITEAINQGFTACGRCY